MFLSTDKIIIIKISPNVKLIKKFKNYVNNYHNNE